MFSVIAGRANLASVPRSTSSFRPLSLGGLCLLLACATGPTPRAASAAEVSRPAQPEPSAEAPAPEPEPLGPLRSFTPDEWKRIRRVQRFVRNAAKRHELSASFINGMIWTESKFERRARGRRGPRGLLQLMPRTARAMAKRLKRKYMPYSADFNIAAGIEYLMLMYERFDRDLHLALAAYNAGPVAVKRWRESGEQGPKPRVRYVMHVERAAYAFCERLREGRYEPHESPFRCDLDEAPAAVANARAKRR